MPIDPKIFATTPEESSAYSLADLARRMRVIEQNSGKSLGYLESPSGSIIQNNTFAAVTDGLSFKMFVPDKPGLILEVFAQATFGAAAAGNPRVAMGIDDGTTFNFTKDLLKSDNSVSSYTTSPGTTGIKSSGANPYGGFVAIDRRDILAVGWQPGRIWTFSLWYTGATGAPIPQWSERKLWVRIP